MRARRLLPLLAFACLVGTAVVRVGSAPSGDDQTAPPQTAPAAGRQGGAPQGGGGGFIAAPARRAGEGLGPLPLLTIRGVMIIDGTGAPPYGPMDVVIANNRIQAIRGSGGRAGGRGAAAPANN